MHEMLKNTALTILAKHAVRYPLPEPTSKAEAPSVKLSLRTSRACACYTTNHSFKYIKYNSRTYFRGDCLTYHMRGTDCSLVSFVENTRAHTHTHTHNVSEFFFFFFFSFHHIFKPTCQLMNEIHLWTGESQHKGGPWNKSLYQWQAWH